jgi:Ca2+-binding RTX toxin-like protein
MGSDARYIRPHCPKSYSHYSTHKLQINIMATTYDALVLQARAQATTVLQNLAKGGGLRTIFQTAFGNSFSEIAYQQLVSAWKVGNFSKLPKIEVLTHGELGLANGAYAAASNTIYLSGDFLARSGNNLATVADVLIEEIGHSVDQFINQGRDSAGDEGEIFRLLARGTVLSASQLAALRGQNDHAVVMVGGRGVAIEQASFFGTDGNDNIGGTDGIDRIKGYAGDDSLTGYAGSDTLDGGAGIDYLDGGAGNDYLVGGGGDDTLVGGAGNDYFIGDGGLVGSSSKPGNDYISGGTGNDTLYGYSGNDDLSGEDGDDDLFGEDGDDTLSGGNGNDTLSGGNGNDYFSGGFGNDTLSGGDGNDYLSGYFGDDYLYSGFGNDYLYGYYGDDSLDGGDGDDSLYGGDGNDSIKGDSGNDYLDGDYGNDSLYGGDGDDTLSGNAGNDALYAEGGNNILYGGLGNDTLHGTGAGENQLYGGGGSDTYYVLDGVDVVYENSVLASSIDKVVASFSYTLGANLEHLALAELAPDALIGIGNGLNNVLTGNIYNNTLDGGIGNDYLNGGLGNDTLYGGSGNDTLSGDAGNDYLNGGLGNDSYTVDSIRDFIVESSALSTEIDAVYSFVNYTLTANVENLTLAYNILAGGSGATNGVGNALNNKIVGNLFNDILTGGLGNDTLDGGDGLDRLVGGAGVDRFVLHKAQGVDTITTFETGEKIQISTGEFGGGLKTGALSSAAFISGAGVTTATNLSQRFIFNTTTGNLYFDANGSGFGTIGSGFGFGTAVQIATLPANSPLTAASFVVTI